MPKQITIIWQKRLLFVDMESNHITIKTLERNPVFYGHLMADKAEVSVVTSNLRIYVMLSDWDKDIHTYVPCYFTWFYKYHELIWSDDGQS